VGTVPYMAPELLDESTYDGKVKAHTLMDAYSHGLRAYHDLLAEDAFYDVCTI
jgi:hypothetical protein